MPNQTIEHDLIECLELYGTEVSQRIDAVTEAAAKRVLERTRLAAPVGSIRRGRPPFHTSLAIQREGEQLGVASYRWYVKKPNYRLTHLLEHGHATRNGGSVAGLHFVQRALEAELPRMAAEIKEVIESVD